MMVHQDGSRHEWVPGCWWDLIVTMDDATSETYSAFFVDEEGTMSSFRALSEVIGEHGRFCSLYADRASHYWHTPDAGGTVDKDNPTQVGRALRQLGIELIPAYSPEARGRSERMFGTLQKRLPQELRLGAIRQSRSAIGGSRASPHARLSNRAPSPPFPPASLPRIRPAVGSASSTGSVSVALKPIPQSLSCRAATAAPVASRRTVDWLQTVCWVPLYQWRWATALPPPRSRPTSSRHHRRQRGDAEIRPVE